MVLPSGIRALALVYVKITDGFTGNCPHKTLTIFDIAFH
jgi:hypothetical protein